METRKIILTRGIPGSGKSTFAKAWVHENSTERVRFNRDDIRNMLGDYWVPPRESLINRIFDSFLNHAMLNKYDIVIDNMNLNKKDVADIINYVQEFNKWVSLSKDPYEYKIEMKDFFDVSLKTCIERDSKRPNPLGEKVITGIYNKYKSEYNFK